MKADRVQYFVAVVIVGFFPYFFWGTSVYVAAPIACVAIGLFPDDFTKLKQTRNYENCQRERTLPASA
ncbi:hypothetical protein SH139x_004721 [Planctomycetaceae bacterium SH139]